MERNWLKCRILKGMFSDERVVVINRVDGRSTSMFVPMGTVRGNIDQEGQVRVDVFADRGATWAVLPTEDRDTLPVNVRDLDSFIV
jgi:hypothetical protein